MADNVRFYVSWLGVFAAGWRHGCVSKQGTFDFDRWELFCQKAANLGAYGIRIMPYETKWLDKNHPEEMFSTHEWDSIQKAWDLARVNRKWLDTLDGMAVIAAKYNLRILLELFDRCQTHTNRDRVPELAPWMNNVQGIPLYSHSITWSKRWINTIVAQMRNQIDYGTGNEVGPYRQTDDEFVKWQAEVWAHLLRLGVPAGNIVFGSLPKWEMIDGKMGIDRKTDLTGLTHNRIGRLYPMANAPHFQQFLSPIQCHHLDAETASYAARAWLGSQSLRVLISNDGVIRGSSKTDMDILPSGEVWRNHNWHEWCYIVDYLLGKVKMQPAYFPKLIIECLPHAPSTPAAWEGEFEGAIQSYHNNYGRWPENYGKFPELEPEPPEPPEPEPEPLPEPKIKVTWQFWAGLLLALVVIIMAVKFFG